jgi:glyoxylase-like metal-dependent hydrolase (beta-lactamase superfamily II)
MATNLLPDFSTMNIQKDVTVDEPYALYALQYARLTTTRGHTFLSGDQRDGPLEMAYYVWVACNSSRAVLIDTGFNANVAQRRGRDRFRCPAEALADVGLQADDIQDVILTHLHYDHAGNLDKFPNARLHLQEREMRFATSKYMCIKHISLGGIFEADDVAQVVRSNFAGRVNWLDGNSSIAPGIDVLLTGGHTPGMQMVRVLTERGHVVLMSDAAHLYENIEHQKPFHIAHSVGDMVAGWRTAVITADSAAHLIPGHDPLVMSQYPKAVGADSGYTVALHKQPTDCVLSSKNSLLENLPSIARAFPDLPQSD